MDQLVAEFGLDNVKAIEHKFLDLRVVKAHSPGDDCIRDDPLMDLFHSNGYIELHNMSHYNALERIWEENESNQATYYYDSVRHYFPKSPRKGLGPRGGGEEGEAAEKLGTTHPIRWLEDLQSPTNFRPNWRTLLWPLLQPRPRLLVWDKGVVVDEMDEGGIGINPRTQDTAY